MQPPPSILIINSIGEIAELHKNIKTLGRDCPGYAGEFILQPIGQEDNLVIHRDTFCLLVRILAKLRCTTLRIMRTTMSFEVDIRVNLLRHLQNVELTLCRGSLVFVRVMFNVCPNLVNFSEMGVERFPVVRSDWNRCMAMVDRIETIIKAVTANCGLLTFESSSMNEELKLLLTASIRPNHRSIMQKYIKSMKSLLQRNHDGYDKCQAAIVQLLLIKRYRPDSVFRLINRNVVRLVAQLLHDTRGTKLWC